MANHKMLTKKALGGPELEEYWLNKGVGLSVWVNFWQEKPDSLKAVHHCEVAPLFGQTSRWPHLSKLNQNLA